MFRHRHRVIAALLALVCASGEAVGGEAPPTQAPAAPTAPAPTPVAPTDASEAVRAALAARLAVDPCGPSLEVSCRCRHLCAGEWPKVETRLTWPVAASGSTAEGLVPLGQVFSLWLGADGRARACGLASATEAPPTCAPPPGPSSP